MRRASILLALLALALGACGMATQRPATAPPESPQDPAGATASPRARGPAAPGFRVETFTGNTFDLAEHRGSPVVLNFWESWCPQCQAEQPHLNQLAEEHRGEVVFAGVSNNDTVEDGKGYVEEYDVPYAVAHAPDVWEAFDVPYQPVTIVIDRDGSIAKRFDGPIEYAQLKEAIQRVL